MQLPRSVLLPSWLMLVAAAYYLVLFTNLGNYYHGGTVLGQVAIDAIVVLAAFSCWEVFRMEQLAPIRALAAAVGVPLFCVLLFTLWFGVQRYVAV